MNSDHPRVRGRELVRLAAIVTLAFVMVFPALWLLHMSLRRGLDAFRMPPKLDLVPTLSNYRDVLEGKFVRSFANSTVVAIATALVSMAVGVPAAYTLSRAEFRWNRHVALWALATRMVPPIAFGVPFFIIYKTLKLLDSRLGLTLIYLTFNLPLVMWIMRAFFDDLPRSLEEAAYVDGAGVAEAFLRVALPLSAPALATTSIFCFLFAWNDFFYALVLTRSQAETAPVAIVNFMSFEGWEWGKITAGSTLIMLPVLLFAFVVRRYLVQGLTGGAVKG